MCLKCGQPAYVSCHCGSSNLNLPYSFNSPSLPKYDVTCIVYNLDNPYGQNNLLNLGLPNGVNLKTIIDQIDKLLGNNSGSGGISTPQDIYVKVDALDGSAGYLANKLTAGNNVSFVILNPNGNENIEINSLNNKVSVDASDTPDYLINQISGSTDGIVTITALDQNGVVGLQPCIDVEALLEAILNIPNYQNIFCQLVTNCLSQVNPCNPPSGLTVSIVGGTATLHWTPGGSTGMQGIEYKLNTSSSFTFFANVSPTTTTDTISGLVPNVLYNFRLTNDCASGDTSTSIQSNGIQISCPTVTITPTVNSATISFPPLGGDINTYKVILLASDGTTILQSKLLGAPFSNPITTVFTGLNADTSYNIQVQPAAGILSNTTCTLVPFTTTALSSCTGPTNLHIVPSNNSLIVNWTPDVTSAFQSLYYGLQSNITGMPPGNGWTAFSGNPLPANQATTTITGLASETTYSIALNSHCKNGVSTAYQQVNSTTPNIITGTITLVPYVPSGQFDTYLTQVNIAFSEPTTSPLTLYFGTTTQSTINATKYARGWQLFNIPSGYVAEPAYHDVTSNYPFFINIPAGTTSYSSGTSEIVSTLTSSIWNNDVPWNGASLTGGGITLTNLYVQIANPIGTTANFTLTNPGIPITNVNL